MSPWIYRLCAGSFISYSFANVWNNKANGKLTAWNAFCFVPCDGCVWCVWHNTAQLFCWLWRGQLELSTMTNDHHRINCGCTGVVSGVSASTVLEPESNVLPYSHHVVWFSRVRMTPPPHKPWSVGRGCCNRYWKIHGPVTSRICSKSNERRSDPLRIDCPCSFVNDRQSIFFFQRTFIYCSQNVDTNNLTVPGFHCARLFAP